MKGADVDDMPTSENDATQEPSDIEVNIAAGIAYARAHYADPVHVKADTPDART